MPRKRDGIIAESPEELQRLESEYRGKPEGLRIATLRLLQERPERPIEEIATMVGFSMATVKRWMRVYREGGLGAVLDRRAGGKDTHRFDAGLNTLKQKLLGGDLATLEEAQRWIEDFRRSPGSRKIAQQAIHRERSVRAAASESAGAGPEPFPDAEAQRTLIAVRVMTALSTRSESADIGVFPEWIQRVNHAICSVFDDVDLVHLIPNVYCPLSNPSGYHPTIAVAHHTDSDPLVAPITEVESGDDAVHIQRSLRMLADQQFKTERYHPPKAFVYYYCDTAYLGMMMLWRDQSRPPISRQTLEVLDSMRSTIMFILTDLVARHRAVWPHQHTTVEAAGELAKDFQLTKQESRIFHLQLLGRSYEQIAEILNISLNTVRTHVKSIYVKSGTHGHPDFTARYLTPQAGNESGNGTTREPGQTRRGTSKVHE